MAAPMEPSSSGLDEPDTADETDETVTVYEPVHRAIPPLGPYLGTLWRRRHFIWHLSNNELRAQNYNTTLGQAWNLLNPLLLAACYLLLLKVLREGNRGESDRVAVLLSGLFFFFFTRNCVQDGARSLVRGEKYLLNASLPRMALPVSSVLEAFLKFVPTLAVYVVVHVALLRESLGIGFAYLPLIIGLQTAFNLGAALTLAVVTVYFRDMSNALNFMTRLWIYITPVLFFVEQIPEHLEPLFQANPLYPLFVSLQRIVGGSTPTGWALIAFAAWAAFMLSVGVLLFASRERDFAVRL